MGQSWVAAWLASPAGAPGGTAPRLGYGVPGVRRGDGRLIGMRWRVIGMSWKMEYNVAWASCACDVRQPRDVDAERTSSDEERASSCDPPASLVVRRDAVATFNLKSEIESAAAT
ncbi:hypothetical protein EJ06DRAFT_521729 [Trichodelitschia bisporula]|uniref:Uncharacterized protein n=1 Tax=Trichodelitschia bisporula TaxID=703511 RepID=A0A6G1HWI1_9PEZI|nr:hypothetical protein EJ06DRAFT_521729 [Trichodelitschia bisporula]